jgi:hypothetical protein
MRNVARLKMGYYPLPESEGFKLRSLLYYSQSASVIDPCVGQGAALHILTKDAPARLYGVELDAERARIASSKGIETVQGNIRRDKKERAAFAAVGGENSDGEEDDDEDDTQMDGRFRVEMAAPGPEPGEYDT